jgi:hypothetical protein
MPIGSKLSGLRIGRKEDLILDASVLYANMVYETKPQHSCADCGKWKNVEDECSNCLTIK